MRSFVAPLIALATFLAGLLPASAQDAQPIQSLFLGQRLCGDTRDICFVAVPLTSRRYLHVIVHSVPGDTDWQVQAGPTCGGPMDDIAGGGTVPDSGYLEAVVDLGASEPPTWERPACYAFRGREHFYVNYYAAYLDDNPAPDGLTVYPGYQALAGRPDLPDLDVTYIHRSPSYAYDAAQNEPRPGEIVTFTAHIGNAGGLPAPPSPYDWLLDGHTVARGEIGAPLAPGDETTVSLPWKWDPGPHTLEVRLHPAGREISAANDILSIRTDALALGFWVERGAWQYFLDRQWQYCAALSCAGSDSFPDWLERQVRVWNGMLADAGYAYPSRVTVADRVRVDEIILVPDGSLPLHGPLATNSPDLDDHTVDLEWGLPAAGVARAYKDGFEGPFDVDLGLIHELSHARSLADLYRFDLALDGTSVVDVLDSHGHPAFDPANPFDPASALRAFYSDGAAPYLYADAEDDLMSCACTRSYGSYDALVLNRLRGRRARCGNANPPCNLGDWFLDIPPLARLRILTGRGKAVPDWTPVRLFFDAGTGYSDHRFVQGDSVQLSAQGGSVELPPDPFRSHADPSRAGHNLLLVEVSTPQRDTFCFLEPTALNVAYWLGYTGVQTPAVLTIGVGHIVDNACNPSLPPARVPNPFATSPQASTAVYRMDGGTAEIAITLRAGGSSQPTLAGRLVQAIRGDGRVLGQGITGDSGTVRLQVRGQPERVVDVTDNDLPIPLTASAPAG